MAGTRVTFRTQDRPLAALGDAFEGRHAVEEAFVFAPPVVTHVSLLVVELAPVGTASELLAHKLVGNACLVK